MLDKPRSNFAWSFSSLGTFETCGEKYAKTKLKGAPYKDTAGAEGGWGLKVHAALATALEHGTPLPSEMHPYTPWLQRVAARPGKLYVEQKYALDRDFCKTEWFSPTVWYRGIADVVRVDADIALVTDWKTGRVQPDSQQLLMLAQCVFAHFPQVQKVATEYVWLKEVDNSDADAQRTVEIFTRQDMVELWPAILERIASMQYAVENNAFTTNPSGLCKKHCPVASCVYYQKGMFRG